MRNLLTPTLSAGRAMTRMAAMEFTGAIPPPNTRIFATEQLTQKVLTLTKPEPSLADLLFDATSEAKIWTSRLATRLNRDTRDRFFRQLDRLHDIEEWTDDGKPLRLGSYKTFVRGILSLGLGDQPALALTSSGNLLAIWRTPESKLSIEFQDGDRVRWVLAEMRDGQVDRIAGDTGLVGLRDRLSQNGTGARFA